MTSHREYIADQDIDQLANLIELSTKKLEDLKKGGWVVLWVVSDSTNQGWFANDDYKRAVEFLKKLAHKHVSEGNCYELGIENQRYRPQEAMRLIDETNRIFPIINVATGVTPA